MWSGPYKIVTYMYMHHNEKDTGIKSTCTCSSIQYLLLLITSVLFHSFARTKIMMNNETTVSVEFYTNNMHMHGCTLKIFS